MSVKNNMSLVKTCIVVQVYKIYFTCKSVDRLQFLQQRLTIYVPNQEEFYKPIFSSYILSLERCL